MEDIEYQVMAAVERDHWWYRGMRRIAQVWLDHAFQHDEHAPWVALDAGCGTGGNMAYLLNRYGSAFGIDVAATALHFGALQHPSHFVRGSVSDLPYCDGCFDLVTAFEVLYHRGVPDEVVALREAWRVLRPGGWLLLRMPAYEWLRSAHDNAVHTRRRYVSAEVRALLQQAGFTVQRCSYINSLLLPLVVGARLAERIRPAAPHPATSAMTPPAAPINAAWTAVLNAESRWLTDHTFPAGLSILALGRKE